MCLVFVEGDGRSLNQSFCCLARLVWGIASVVTVPRLESDDGDGADDGDDGDDESFYCRHRFSNGKRREEEEEEEASMLESREKMKCSNE